MNIQDIILNTITEIAIERKIDENNVSWKNIAMSLAEKQNKSIEYGKKKECECLNLYQNEKF